MDIDEPYPTQPSRAPGSTTPAGLELRLKLLSLFCKSAAAANCFPQTLEVRLEGGLYDRSLVLGLGLKALAQLLQHAVCTGCQYTQWLP